MGDGETFGQWLSRHMRLRKFERPVDLARETGISPSLIGRWMRDEALPGMANLKRLAPALGVSVETAAAKAGHLDGEEPADADLSPLIVELSRLLDPNGPVPDDERQTLATLIDHVISPYRRHLRKRRAG